jgi:hypothetical protein
VLINYNIIYFYNEFLILKPVLFPTVFPAGVRAVVGDFGALVLVSISSGTSRKHITHKQFIFVHLLRRIPENMEAITALADAARVPIKKPKSFNVNSHKSS